MDISMVCSHYHEQPERRHDDDCHGEGSKQPGVAGVSYGPDFHCPLTDAVIPSTFTLHRGSHVTHHSSVALLPLFEGRQEIMYRDSTGTPHTNKADFELNCVNKHAEGNHLLSQFIASASFSCPNSQTLALSQQLRLQRH